MIHLDKGRGYDSNINSIKATSSQHITGFMDMSATIHVSTTAD